MDSRVEEILKAFPGLRYDEGFQITSPEDVDYNCIAWAFGRKDCWMWPDEDVDGVDVWPENAGSDLRGQTFIDAFRTLGYDVCNNDEYEEGIEKVALYAYPNSEECTHAARLLPNGMWTSKLGPSFDISHSTPYTIQGRLYGMVCCIMCRPVIL
jgi:hypothetical protein